MNDDCKIFLDPIYVPPADTKHELDIVAIHGLNPTGKKNHARETWSGGDKKDVLWLRDFLPTMIPNARVLLFGYNSSVAIDSSIAGIPENADTLLQMLHLKRNNDSTKSLPIIFVCHSLGGLVTKKALVQAVLADIEENLALKNSTFGVVFFATPHKGGKHAKLGEVVSSVARFCLRTPKNTNLEALKDTLFSDGLLKEFHHQQRHYHFVSFYETKKYRKFGPVVLSPESAILGAEKELAIAIDADHSEICRYGSRAGIYEQQVEPTLVEFVKKALVAAKEKRAQPKLKRKLRESEVKLMRDVIGMLEIPKHIFKFTKRQEAMWKKFLDESTRDNILAWLSDIEYEEHYHFHVDQIVKGTCLWLLEHDKFKIWHESTASEILWLRGDPGTGKTKLTSHIIRYCIQEKERLESNEAIAYFYCDRNEPRRSTDLGLIFNTILKQLSFRDQDGPLHSIIATEYQIRKRRNNPPRKFTLDDSLRLITELTGVYPRTTIIIDGIDEITAENGIRLDFIDGIQRIIRESEGLVKVFLSSRFEGDIALRLRNVRNHYITPTDNSQDIELFVYTLVQRYVLQGRLLPGESVSEELKLHICRSLCRHSKGMFLWSYLQLGRLCECFVEEEIRDLFSTGLPQPDQLKSVYDEIFKRIVAEKNWGSPMAVGLMQLIMAARRPLKADEVCAMVCAEVKLNRTIPMDKILATCHNLVIEDKEQGVVRFCHLSAREYMEKEKGHTARATHNTALKLCLRLIEKHATNAEQKTGESLNPVLNYALLYWLHHCLIVHRLGVDEYNHEELKRFFFGPRGVGVGVGFSFFHSHIGCLPINYNDKLLTHFRSDAISSSPSMAAIYTASLLGYQPFIIYSLSSGDLHDFEGWHDRLPKPLKETPLTLAIERGHKRISEMLFQKGYFEIQKGKYDSILDVASTHGNLTLVRQLLNSRDFGDTKLLSVNKTTMSPSMTQKLRIKEHIYPAGELVRVSKALITAAGKGHLQICKDLVSFGADVNYAPNTDEEWTTFEQCGCWTHDIGSPLVAAAYHGRKDVLELLLHNGALVNQGTCAGYALSAAAYQGSITAMEILLRNGADPNQDDPFYGRPLFAAIYSDFRPDFRPVSILLDYGATLNFQGTRNQSVIFAAIEQDSVEVLEVLFQNGLELSLAPEDPDQMSLSELAVGYTSWNALDWLLSSSNEEDVNERIEDGNSLLIEALTLCTDGEEAAFVVEVFLRHNVDVNAVGGAWGSALSAAAACRDSLEAMRLLIANGANIDVGSERFGCPLATAIRFYNPEAVKFLLDHGADVNFRWADSSCPLRVVEEQIQKLRSKEGDFGRKHLPKVEEIKKILLDHGAKYV